MAFHRDVATQTAANVTAIAVAALWGVVVKPLTAWLATTTGQEWYFALGWVLLVTGIAVWGVVEWRRRRVGPVTNDANTLPDAGTVAAREMLVLFNKEGNEAIVNLRDKQGNAVHDLPTFRDFVITAGRWSGRIEYLVGKFENAFPNEVHRFLVIGSDPGLSFVPSPDPVIQMTRHLQAIITVRVNRLRELTAAMQKELNRN